MKLLEVENLTVQYPGSTNPACKVSFQVESGELLGIAGASGSREKHGDAVIDGDFAGTGTDHQRKIEAARDKKQ